MEYLPDEIIKIIYDFTPTSCKINLSKSHFKTHYYLATKEKKIDKRYHNYLRYLIQKKCSMHLDIVMHIFCGKFLAIKNWKFKNNTYPNFLSYLKDFSLHNNSQKCYEMIKELLEPSKKINIKE